MPDNHPFADRGHSPYPLLCEALPDATIIVDNHGVISFANRKACSLFGWTRAELVGSKVERLIPSRFAGVHEQHRQHYNDSPSAQPTGTELFGLRSDGTEFPLEIALGPFKMGTESMVVASIRDLTGSLRFREAAKRAQYGSQVVKLGELALRSKDVDELLVDVPDFIVKTLSTDIVIVYWGLHGSELRPRIIHGIPEAIVGKPEIASAIGLDGKDMAANERPRIVSDYRDETGIDATLARELSLSSSLRVPLATKAGLVGLLVTYSRRTSQFGEEELYFLQAVGNVVVEAFMRAEVEAQLAHAQRLESIGQLTGGIAHDFNNILTVVLGNLQMLREALEQSGGGEFVKLVESAQRASKRGAELTNKLLTFARKQSLAPSAIDPAVALGALTDMLQRAIGEAIQIELQVTPGCPPCVADALQLDNAIVNLALNARDSMPAGGQLRIAAAPFTVRADMPEMVGDLAPGVYVVISVADTGQGMSPEVLSRAYEPFFTTKKSGKGSGLGLSMVYGFVMQSGGTIRIDSEPGRGTEVEIYFPAAERRSPASASRGSVQDHEPATPPGQETILVVDDDLEVLNLADVFLTRSGYHVLRASDTAEALHCLKGPEPISLLFTDVVLGAGETGPKLAAEALTIRPRLPVLYTSGYAHGSLSAANSGPIQFLAKPYQREDLIKRIEVLLTEERRQRGA